VVGTPPALEDGGEDHLYHGLLPLGIYRSFGQTAPFMCRQGGVASSSRQQLLRKQHGVPRAIARDAVASTLTD
jgi:hypothetical protein